MSVFKNASLGKLSLELLLIFIAVFLAFGINEWRDSRNNIKLANAALESLTDEINRNKQRIEYGMPGREEVVKKLNASSDPAMLDSLTFFPIILRNTAWRTASETGAFIYMDYQKVNALSEVYTFQETYAGLTDKLLASSFALEHHTKNNKEAQLSSLKWVANVFLRNEQLLIEAYDKALSEIEIEK